MASKALKASLLLLLVGLALAVQPCLSRSLKQDNDNDNNDNSNGSDNDNDNNSNSSNNNNNVNNNDNDRNSSNSNSNGSSAMSTDDILDEDVCSDNNNIGDVSTLFPGGMGNTTVEKTYTVNPEDDNDDNNGDECHLALKGFDVTGVTNEFALPSAGNLRSACDCVKECVKRIGTCHAWAWKYTGGEQRTCVLTSNTALPPQVSLAYDLGDGSGSSAGNETDMDGNEQYGRIRPNNLKQEGALVPRCTLNNGSYDNDCRSGTIFLLAGGIVIC